MSSAIVVPKVESIQFHGDELHAIRRDDGQVFVPVKRLCEALGIDDDSQVRKLRKKTWAVTVTTTATGPDGKRYEMTCLSLKTVPMWLATLDASRVDSAAAVKLARYQQECADVLAAHFGATSEPQATSLAVAPTADAAALVGSIASLVSAFASQQAATEARLLAAQASSERRLLTVIEGLGRATRPKNALRVLPGGKSGALLDRQATLFAPVPPTDRCKPNWFVRQTRFASHVDGNPSGCHRRAVEILRGFGARPDADGRYERSYAGAFKAAVEKLAA